MVNVVRESVAEVDGGQFKFRLRLHAAAVAHPGDDDFGTDDGDDGWFEDVTATGTDDLSDYTFTPGEAFLLFSGDGAITLQFPEVQ